MLPLFPSALIWHLKYPLQAWILQAYSLSCCLSRAGNCNGHVTFVQIMNIFLSWLLFVCLFLHTTFLCEVIEMGCSTEICLERSISSSLCFSENRWVNSWILVTSLWFSAIWFGCPWILISRKLILCDTHAPIPKYNRINRKVLVAPYQG